MLKNRVNGWNNEIICELNLTTFTEHMQKQFQKQFGDTLHSVDLIANIHDEMAAYGCSMQPDLSNDTIHISGTASNCNTFFVDFGIANNDINIFSETIIK